MALGLCPLGSIVWKCVMFDNRIYKSHCTWQLFFDTKQIGVSSFTDRLITESLFSVLYQWKNMNISVASVKSCNQLTSSITDNGDVASSVHLSHIWIAGTLKEWQYLLWIHRQQASLCLKPHPQAVKIQQYELMAMWIRNLLTEEKVPILCCLVFCSEKK